MRPRPFVAFLFALALTVGHGAVAEEAGRELPGQIALQEIATRLELTAEQQARIEPALEERNAKLKVLAGKLDANASRRQKLKVLREGRDIQQQFVAAVTPVLTKEQNAEWQKMRDETRGQLAERRQRRQR